MSAPWNLYDDLLSELPENVMIEESTRVDKWCRVRTSQGGMGSALALPERSRPAVISDTSIKGISLREAGQLVKSWNFVEAAYGLAAINAWYAHPKRAEANGFTPCENNAWYRVFDPFADRVAGTAVTVIGHFPFAAQALGRAKELRILEKNTQDGDYPDSACEYLLPDSDYVFISGSALVNKTMPRLLELSKNATTIILGPSTTLSPKLFDYGADHLTGFVPTGDRNLFAVLNQDASAMYESGYRVELTRE